MSQSRRDEFVRCRRPADARRKAPGSRPGPEDLIGPRYLDGHVALFPDAVTAWAERLRLAQELAVMADRFAELDGLTPAAPPELASVSVRVTALLADLVEPARSTALDKLDEGRQALAIATGWLRSKATPLALPPDGTDPDGSPLAPTL